MNPENQNSLSDQPAQKKVITPINAAEVKAYVEENRTPPQPVPNPVEISAQPFNPVSKSPTGTVNTSSNTQHPWDERKNVKNFKKYVKYIAIGLVVLVIAFVVYSIKYANTYTKINVTGPGFTYSVNFDRNSKSAIDGKNSLLQGTSLHNLTKVLVTVGPAPTITGDCHAGAGSSITVISKGLVNGEQHNLCYASSVNSYEANFQHDGHWYYVSIKPYSGTSKVNLETVQAVVNSLSID